MSNRPLPEKLRRLYNVDTADELWSKLLTEGNVRSRRYRPIFGRLPSNPRCVNCHRPFNGIGGVLMRSIWGELAQKSDKNPRYCAGCHGFNGLAFYPPAPSFAMGDRLAKRDLELMSSILKGKGAMPSWESKLPRYWLEQALAYIRHMAQEGNINVPPNWDGRYFIFTPLGSDPTEDWRIP